MWEIRQKICILTTRIKSIETLFGTRSRELRILKGRSIKTTFDDSKKYSDEYEVDGEIKKRRLLLYPTSSAVVRVPK